MEKSSAQTDTVEVQGRLDIESLDPGDLLTIELVDGTVLYGHCKIIADLPPPGRALVFTPPKGERKQCMTTSAILNRYRGDTHFHIGQPLPFQVIQDEVVCETFSPIKSISWTYENPFSGTSGQLLEK